MQAEELSRIDCRSGGEIIGVGEVTQIQSLPDDTESDERSRDIVLVMAEMSGGGEFPRLSFVAPADRFSLRDKVEIILRKV